MSSPAENLADYHRESKEFLEKIWYRPILDAMSESIWIGDEHERTVYANPNFCRLVGYELDEIIGLESYIFWDEDSANTVRNNNQLRNAGEASKYKWTLKSKTGELIPVFLSGTPLGNGGTAGIITDLREIKAIREHAEKLDRLNRMKDDFVSVMGHELRTPLTSIKGYLSMVLDGDVGELTPTAQRYVTIAYNEAERLIALVGDMLDVAKLDAEAMRFDPQDISVAELLAEIAETMAPIPEGRWLIFATDLPLVETRIVADPGKLKQVIINLLGNAFKFTPKGGTITLGAAVESDHRVRLFVRDTGIGIPEKNLESIFEKFGQVDNYLQKSTAGTGLGLYISSIIVARSGGRLSVVSKVGEGSEFSFVLDTSRNG